MKIGFFGDSFCAEMNNTYTWKNKYDTYINKLQDHYKAKIVNLGYGGSSYWDLILYQFPKFINNLPDVCIFVWTSPGRIYHPECRNITSWVLDIDNVPISEFHYTRLLYKKKYKVAAEFYKELYNEEKEKRERLAALYHYDREVLLPLMEKTKIIHLWSFGNFKTWHDPNTRYSANNMYYDYRFLSGTECRPALENFSKYNKDVDYNTDTVSNHLFGNEINDLVKNMLVEAIDNHGNGKVLDFNL
jgi:hypothetical protein